jgi:hypothetical protein
MELHNGKDRVYDLSVADMRASAVTKCVQVYNWLGRLEYLVEMWINKTARKA